MNSLKIDQLVVFLVINKTKNTTRKLFDKKNLKIGEIVRLIKRPELTIFGDTKITSINKTTMGKLTIEDKKGHEKLESEKNKCTKLMLGITTKL